jgi:hypothetical protein
MTQQGNGHVAQHGEAVGRSTVQLAKAVTVTHGKSFRLILFQFFDRLCKVLHNRGPVV